MPRYIDADVLMHEYQNELCYEVECGLCPFCADLINGGCKFEDFVNSTPTADVVEVVRCKDCTNYDSHGHRCKHWNHGVTVAEWCSRRERREDDTLH